MIYPAAAQHERVIQTTIRAEAEAIYECFEPYQAVATLATSSWYASVSLSWRNNQVPRCRATIASTLPP